MICLISPGFTIRKLIEASQKMINEQNSSLPVNEHFKLQIKTLQNAPRDADKLERHLKVKERKRKEGFTHVCVCISLALVVTAVR